MRLDLADLRPTRAEIYLDRLEHNLDEIRRVVPATAGIMPVVKADAYGHGAIECVQLAETKGVRNVGVATLEEAQELRQADISSDILVLGPLLPNQLPKALTLGVTVAVTETGLGRALAAAAQTEGRRAKVHVKVDTGMSRIGFPWATAAREIAELARLPGLDMEGIFTHFAVSEAPDKAYTRLQYQRFEEVLSSLAAAGLSFRYRHSSNSGAALDLPEMALDLVRVGIVMYGLYPGPEVSHEADLRPVMRLVSRVTRVMEWPAGTPVSYGSTYVTTGQETLITVPIGYADGYSRLLSDKADAIVGGHRCRVVGRVCMDQFMARVPAAISSSVEVGDEVVIVGAQGDEMVPMEELAYHMGTSNYEITCMIDKRVPRVFMADGVVQGVRTLG